MNENVNKNCNSWKSYFIKMYKMDTVKGLKCSALAG